MYMYIFQIPETFSCWFDHKNIDATLAVTIQYDWLIIASVTVPQTKITA